MENPQAISAILFDLDNTLIDTRGVDRKAVEKIHQYMTQHAVPESCAREMVEEYLKCFRANPQDPIPGRTDLDSWRRLLWAYALGPEWDYLLEKVYPLWKKTRFDNLLFSDQVKSMLKSLGKKYKLAIITNGPSAAQWEKIHRLKASDYFDCTLVSGDLPVEKPDAEIFQMAFESLSVSAEECVMIGDKLSTDIQGGLNAGVAATVWVPLQDSDRPHPRPHYKVTHVCELLSLLSPSASSSASGGSSSGVGKQQKTTTSSPSVSSSSSKSDYVRRVSSSSSSRRLSS